jgi:hypothetical protein
MEVSGQLHAPALYPQVMSPWYPLDRRLCGLWTRSGRGGEEKNSQPLPGLESPIIQPVAQRYTAELSRLLHWPTIRQNFSQLIALGARLKNTLVPYVNVLEIHKGKKEILYTVKGSSAVVLVGLCVSLVTFLWQSDINR